jgi:hypothetical protein
MCDTPANGTIGTFQENAQSFHDSRNIYRLGDLVLRGVKSRFTRMEPSQITDNIDIDRKTSRSICDEMGERLQEDLYLEASPLPPYLSRLVDELRKQEEMRPPKKAA